MCYHTANPGQKTLTELYDNMEVIYEGDVYYHVNGYSRPFLPVTLADEQNMIQAARWKMLPYWVKTDKEAIKYANTLNAKAETIFELKTFKNSALTKRGLLYVNGFFEPHKVRGDDYTQNYFIYKENHEVFTLGILYNTWKDQETGDSYPTFTIITVEANELLAKIHNEKKRMPLIVEPKDWDKWLNSTDEEEIKSMMKPYDGELKYHQVYRVTGARGEDTNRPDIQDPIS